MIESNVKVNSAKAWFLAARPQDVDRCSCARYDWHFGSGGYVWQ